MTVDCRLARLLLPSLIVLAVAAAASAQSSAPAVDAAPRVELTPFFGYGGDLNWLVHDHHHDSGFDDFAHEGSGAFGGRVAVRMNGPVSIEASAGAAEPFHQYGNGPYTVSGPVAYANLTSLTYEVNLLYEIRDSEWAPFVTAGGGAFTTWPEHGSAWTDPSANVGGGLKIYVQPRLALRMELRGYIGRFRQMGADGILRSSGVSAHPQISMGVGFGF